MIDLGIAKLAMIGAVALIVIGPEKLPKVARMAGSLFGRAQRYMNQVKAEVSREMELDELSKMKADFEAHASEFSSSMNKKLHEVEQSVNSIWHDDHPMSTVLPDSERLGRKIKEFRRKKLARTSALPVWYKQQHGSKMHLLSGSARVAKYRPRAKSAQKLY